MAKNLWDEFDKAVDTEALAKDVENSASGNFREVPHGEYEVSVEKMELVATKNTGKPMLSVWFKILNGEYKGSMIFMNQVIERPFQLHIANEFLRSLTEGMEINVEFKTYNQYGNLIMDIHEAIADNREYALKYAEGKNGFNRYEITDIFDLD